MNVPRFKHLPASLWSVLAIWWLAIDFCALHAAPVVVSFSTTQTGTDTQVWATTQSEDGTLYFGADGLVSFDGSHWQTTPLNGGYAMRGVAIGDNGRIWGAANHNLGWFGRDDSGAWVFHSLRENLPFPLSELGEMWHVFAEPTGALFVSENKILRWKDGQFQCWPMLGSRRLHAFSVQGNIYVQHVPTGLYVMEAAGPRLLIPAEKLGDNPIFWLERKGDSWVFATPNGLFTFTDGQLTAFAPEASEYVVRETLTCGARLPNGEIALGTLRGGIAFVGTDGSLKRVLTETNGLPTSVLYSLFLDREGNLWGTSRSYIFRLPATPVTTLFDQHAGLPAQPTLRVLRHENQTFLATENGLYQTEPGGEVFHLVDPFRERIRDMHSLPEGLLLARLRSVALFSNGSFKTLFRTPRDPIVAKPSRTLPGVILVSTGRQIVGIENFGESRVLVDNLPDIVTSIAEDANGQFWLGTYAAGLLVAQPSLNKTVEATPANAPGLPTNSGPAFAAATDAGAIIVFNGKGGWIRGARADRFQPIQNFPARWVSGFSYLPSEDSFWMIHTASSEHPAFAARVIVHDDQAEWQPHSVEGLWEIGSPRALFAEATSNGTVLWIGGTKNLLRHEVPHGPVALAPRSPLLRGFARTAETETPHLITHTLPYATKSVRFEFAAPEFSRLPALRLETFIDGVDHNWVPADATAVRELTAIRDGKYVFHVRAVAETGLASEPTTFNFEILAPWWRTTPAIIGVVLALLPGAYGIYRLRVRALRRRNAELEEKVGQRTEQLAKASAAKTEFVANMSHDIRNPLNGIVGLALALEDTRLDPRQREIVATLRECGTYLSSLVDDVLDFATIEAGQVELRPGPFAAAELLRSVATTLKGDAAEQGATILIEVDPKLPPTVVGDAGRIQQILVNYASNAVKYAGGTIRLIARMPAESPGEIEFVVADQGPGLTETETAALFTKFTRLPSARNESIKGAGLGLAACRSLADIMGGSVGVESQRGVGSKFFLRLPLVISQPREPSSTFSLPAARVLLVEDADYNAWAAAAVLTKLNLPHERARTGEEALRMFAEKRFDVVLLDRNLPDMDGTEVAKKIREFEADTSRAILLAVTAYCTAEDRALCLAAGMDAFVGKPLTPEKLRRVLLAAGRRLLAAASVQVSTDLTAATPAPTVDVSLLNYLSDGTDEGLGEQIDRFLTTLSKVEDQLEHAASARDFAAVASTSHQMLSQAKMVGAFALDTAATALEHAARREDQAAFGPLLEQLRHDSAALKAALRRHRSATHST